MRKPNLFIVGHPRTGTTSLHDYLNQHPDIFMSPIKEPNYFTKDFHKESDLFHKKQVNFPFRTEKKYLSLYHNLGNEKIAGEATATTLYSKISSREISRFNPDAKIIMTFREPVDFLFSYHSIAVYTLGESIKDFKTALAAEEERRNGRLLSKRIIAPSWYIYSDFINYTEQAKRFLACFPPEQIKIIIFDDFKKNTGRTLNEIFTFLEVDAGFKPDINIVNPYNKIVRWPRLKHYLFDSPYFRRLLRRLVPYEVYSWLGQFFMKVASTGHPKQKIDEHFRKELMLRYKDEVVRFEEFIGRDLVTLWKYDLP